MTKRAQKGSERSDFLAHCRSHPHADNPRVGSVVPKKFDGSRFLELAMALLLTLKRHMREPRRPC